MNEDLSQPQLKEIDVTQIWRTRKSRMALRREYFESLWRSGIQAFFQGIVGETINGSRPLYNNLYEQYDFSLFSRDGLQFNNLKYPLVHSIVMRALASEIPNKPKINFIAEGTNDQSKAIAFRHLFDQVLYEMNADAEDFEVFLGRRIFGSAAVMVYTDQYKIRVKDPVWDTKKEEMTYVSKEKKIKKVQYKNIDLRHLYLDEHCSRTDLTDCGYAIYDEYYSKEEFKTKFAEYGEDKIKKACDSLITKDEATVYYNWYDTRDAEFVRVSHCFDKIYDCYHIIAGAGEGVLLNDVDSPIPRIAGRTGKDLPFALAVLYKIPNAPYGYGDAHVTRSFNQIKNIIRMMLLEITQKAAKPMLAIDPLSNFDEQAFEWAQDFIRVSPNDLHEIKIDPDLKSLYDMDKLSDDDIIRVTGININDIQSATHDETARKSIIRRESQIALVALTMDYMSDSYFLRLYTLMKDEVRLHYGTSLKNGEEVKVRTKDVLVSRTKKGNLDEEKVSGFRYFNVELGDIDMDVELDLELGNMATSRELDKAMIKEQTDAMIPWLQFFNGQGVAQMMKDGYHMPDEVLNKKEGQISGQDPKEIANASVPQELLPQTEQQMQEMMSQPTPNEVQDAQAAQTNA